MSMEKMAWLFVQFCFDLKADEASNWLLQPIIDPQHLKDPDDVKTLVDAGKIVKKLFDSIHFKDAKLSPRMSSFCQDQKPWSDGYYKCVVQNHGMTAWHPVGTCKMGSSKDPMAVVDSNLKLIGLNNLRVIDASVMPKIVGGNTNAATVMIGEKGADMIMNEQSDKDVSTKAPAKKDEL